MAVQIELLSDTHARSEFDCGEPSLNDFLQKLASQYHKRNLGRTFVAVEVSHPKVLGYYTLATGKIEFENLPVTKKLPRLPVPIVLLGRLAVDKTRAGEGLGELLLLHALWRAQQTSQQVAVYAVEVTALHEKAAGFYRKYGFTPLLDNPLHLYLSMAGVTALGLDFTDDDPSDATCLTGA